MPIIIDAGSVGGMMSERLRLETLVARDGLDEAKRWASWAAALYRQSMQTPGHYASQAELRPLFEQSSREFDNFVKTGLIPYDDREVNELQ
jgi:hypothetical protein